MTSLFKTDNTSRVMKTGQAQLEAGSPAHAAPPSPGPDLQRSEFWQELQKLSQSEKAQSRPQQRAAKPELGPKPERPTSQGRPQIMAESKPRPAQVSHAQRAPRPGAEAKAEAPSRVAGSEAAEVKPREVRITPRSELKRSPDTVGKAKSAGLAPAKSPLVPSMTNSEALVPLVQNLASETLPLELASTPLDHIQVAPLSSGPEIMAVSENGLIETIALDPFFIGAVTELANHAAPGIPLTQPQPLTMEAHELQSLNFTLGGRDKLLEQAPALALLTGHLELIAPGSLPGLVAENPLLQNILGSTDLQQLMQQPASLHNILQELGLQGTPLAHSIEAHGQGGELSNLKEVLNALGFDVERIMKEGQLLQQTLPLEGLQPYMLRAAKLRAQLDSSEAQAIAGLSSLSLPQVPLSTITVPDQAAPLNAALRAPMPRQGLAQELPVLAQLEAAPFEVLSVIYPALANEISSFDLSPPLLDPLPPEAVATRASTDLPVLPPQASEILTANFAERPLAQLTANDPFAAIKQMMQNGTVQEFAFDKILAPSRESIPELNLSNDFPTNAAANLGMALFQLPAEGSPAALPLEGSALMEIGESSHLLLGQDLRQDQGGDFRQQEDRGSFQGSEGPSSALASQNLTNASGTQSTFELQASPAAPAALSLRKEALQQIFDKASMMLNEGGGSIRLDLGTESLGTLDLALDIKDSSIELRIIASSQQARDMLAQELPKLRDSLMQQNLQLDKVEIGLSHGSAWSQSSGNGQSSRGQSQEFFEQASFKGPAGRREKFEHIAN